MSRIIDKAIRKGMLNMKKSSGWLWGAVLILVGICYAGNVIFGWSFNIWAWWSLVILIPCLGGLLTEGPNVGNLIGIVIGAAFLPPVRAIFDFQVIRGLIIPAIFIIVGLSIIFKESWRRKFQPKNINVKVDFDGNSTNGETSSKNVYEYNATFSSQNVSYPSDIFEGAVANAIFGSVVMDLRNAIITEDVVLTCSAIFGGIDILMPSNVNIKVSSTPIFGGVSNKNKNIVNPVAPIVYVNATCMFGGVDIK